MPKILYFAVALGLLALDLATKLWGRAALAAVAALLVVCYLWRTPVGQPLQLSAFTFLLGGILGNLIYRTALGFVNDWIDVKFGAWHYPTFNFAELRFAPAPVY